MFNIVVKVSNKVSTGSWLKPVLNFYTVLAPNHSFKLTALDEGGMGEANYRWVSKKLNLQSKCMQL